jgi:hypothetical protein
LAISLLFILAVGLLFIRFARTAVVTPDSSKLPSADIASADPAPSNLTPEDIAGVLGLHWWILNVPADAGDNAAVKIHWAVSNPDKDPDVATISDVKPGEILKLFYMAGDSAHEPKFGITSLSTYHSGGIASFAAYCYSDMSPPADFVLGAVTSIGNGSVVKSGDILIKEARKIPDIDTEIAPGNALKPNEIGLKIELTKEPAVAAK